MRFHSRLGLGVCFLAMAGVPALLHGQSPPSLGAADSFAVLGGSSVTSTGSTVVTGNLGVSPGNTISGSITVKVGATYRNDSIARQAQRDATSAYNDLAGRTCTATLTGLPLAPGVYCLSSPAQLPETLILDAANDPNAVWIFKVGGTLTTANGSSVRVINNGYEGNIFWQVGDSVILNAGTTFVGNVLAHNDITLHAGASISGRLLAQGAVFLDGNNISLCCGPVIVSPETLPNGTVCTPYPTATFTASGGMTPYTFSVASDSVASGPLPDGLTLADGVLSGIPTRQGSFKVLITATDSKGCTGARSYVIDIGCPPAGPAIPLLPVKACEFHCQQIPPGCGTGPHLFSVTSGALPAGLVLFPDGMLCGKPNTPGDYAFDITDDSASGCPRHYTLQVSCNIMIAPETLPNATCTSYCEVLTASCGTPPYTFNVSSGTPPSGVILGADGKLCGTPTTPGSSTFIVTVSDAKGCTASRSYTVVVNPQLTIQPPTLPDGVVCETYVQPITPSCGTPPYTCKLLIPGTLPPGLTLTDCVISGTPTVAGPFTFTVQADDSKGSTTTRPYTIVITCPKITIDPPVLPPATTCQQFCVKLTPSCAVGTTVFSVTGGALPPGGTLSPDGLLCVSPSVPGDYSWTVTFADSVSGCTGSVSYTLPVTAGVTITPPCLPDAPPGVPYSEMFTASGGTAPYTFALNGTLPPGLTFMQTTPTTATVSGTPTTLGCFPYTVTVTDANGCSTSTTCRMCVAVGGPTLTGWGMVVLSILLAGTGIVMMRRGGG
jgi:hypothetical protein